MSTKTRRRLTKMLRHRSGRRVFETAFMRLETTGDLRVYRITPTVRGAELVQPDPSKRPVFESGLSMLRRDCDAGLITEAERARMAHEHLRDVYGVDPYEQRLARGFELYVEAERRGLRAPWPRTEDDE